MAGSDFVFNIAKGRQAQYGDLSGANDALLLVVLQASGLEGDAALRDYNDLAALLAGTSNECTATGYARQTLTGVTVTVDDTGDRVNVDCNDVNLGVVGTAGAGQLQGKVLLCYDGDTTAGTDSNIIPVSAHSYDVTFEGTSVTIQMPTDGPFFDQ